MMLNYIVLFCFIDAAIYFLSFIFSKKYREKFLGIMGDGKKEFIFFVHILMIALIVAEIYYLVSLC